MTYVRATMLGTSLVLAGLIGCGGGDGPVTAMLDASSPGQGGGSGEAGMRGGGHDSGGPVDPGGDAGPANPRTDGGPGSPSGDAGPGAPGGDGGPTDPGSDAGPGGDAGPAEDPPLCITEESQVVIIGDSYINWATHTLPADLAEVSGQQWRLYAQGGASMGSGGIATPIPDQFETAVSDDSDIRAVVMDGGGNDILIPDTAQFPGAEQCKNSADAGQMEVCQEIVTLAIETAKDLMDRAVEVGVKDVVYFFYPEVPEGTAVGGTNPNAILNYALPMVRDTCENAETRTDGQLRCHFVNMIPVFEGHNPEWFAPTDIHPNAMGSAAMADAIWAEMQEECVGQPPSSGCCMKP